MSPPINFSLVEAALRINSGSLALNQVDVVREYQARPMATTDKHKIMQILVDFLRHAKHACDESGRTDKQITIRTMGDGRNFKIIIEDNGVGIPEQNLTHIFNHGFTTRKPSRRFGLQSAALAANELEVTSGSQWWTELGATFISELPYALVPSEYENRGPKAKKRNWFWSCHRPFHVCFAAILAACVRYW